MIRTDVDGEEANTLAVTGMSTGETMTMLVEVIVITALIVALSVIEPMPTHAVGSVADLLKNKGGNEIVILPPTLILV